MWFRKKVRTIILDVKIPKEVIKPIRAMEMVLSSMWQAIYKPPDWWETWIDGEVQLAYTFEIVSLGGDIHFLIRTPDDLRGTVESAIYAQYPNAEISLFEDYTKKVPQDIPNIEWNLWASDYKLLRDDAYPIKTYTDFETEKEVEEEKRIDPLSILLEGMARMRPDEQLWVQVRAKPVTDAEKPWITEGHKLKDKLARRIEKETKQKPLIFEALDVILFGQVPEKPEEKKEVLPPEMKLTPGEREVLSKVEEKLAKPAFETSIRFIYLGKRENFLTSNIRLVFGYFAAFTTQNCNMLIPWGDTLTKIHKSKFLIPNFVIDRRLYLKKRQIFRHYITRTTPKDPRPGGTFILNLEEMATIFHFPGRTSAPAPFISRIEAKKGEAPPNLPTE
jgi:hypothetical protein